MLRPFTFSDGTGRAGIFSAIFGHDLLNNIQNIIMALGISIAILLLIVSLIKVATGRLSNDIPDPIHTCIRFLLALFMCYWGSIIIFDYIFPFIQVFLDKALNLNATSTPTIGEAIEKAMKGYIDTSSGEKAVAIGLAYSGASMYIVLLRIVIFLIATIMVFIQMFKLIIENAERYLTVSLLVLCTPLAASTLVSKKTSEIFRAWLQMLASCLLTIFFNILGVKLLIAAFDNVSNACWGAGLGDALSGTSLLGFVTLLAACKMVQKFDQLLSMLTFKINPIQNRSLIFGTLSNVSNNLKAMNSISEALTGKKIGFAGKGKGGSSGGSGGAKIQGGKSGGQTLTGLTKANAEKPTMSDLVGSKNKGFIGNMFNTGAIQAGSKAFAYSKAQKDMAQQGKNASNIADSLQSKHGISINPNADGQMTSARMNVEALASGSASEAEQAATDMISAFEMSAYANGEDASSLRYSYDGEGTINAMRPSDMNYEKGMSAYDMHTHASQMILHGHGAYDESHKKKPRSDKDK